MSAQTFRTGWCPPDFVLDVRLWICMIVGGILYHVVKIVVFDGGVRDAIEDLSTMAFWAIVTLVLRHRATRHALRGQNASPTKERQ